MSQEAPRRSRNKISSFAKAVDNKVGRITGLTGEVIQPPLLTAQSQPQVEAPRHNFVAGIVDKIKSMDGRVLYGEDGSLVLPKQTKRELRRKKARITTASNVAEPVVPVIGETSGTADLLATNPKVQGIDPQREMIGALGGASESQDATEQEDAVKAKEIDAEEETQEDGDELAVRRSGKARKTVAALGVAGALLLAKEAGAEPPPTTTPTTSHYGSTTPTTPTTPYVPTTKYVAPTTVPVPTTTASTTPTTAYRPSTTAAPTTVTVPSTSTTAYTHESTSTTKDMSHKTTTTKKTIPTTTTSSTIPTVETSVPTTTTTSTTTPTVETTITTTSTTLRAPTTTARVIIPSTTSTTGAPILIDVPLPQPPITVPEDVPGTTPTTAAPAEEEVVVEAAPRVLARTGGINGELLFVAGVLGTLGTATLVAENMVPSRAVRRGHGYETDINRRRRRNQFRAS